MSYIVVKSRAYKRRVNFLLGTVYCVQWSPDGELLASASADTTAKVTNLKTRTVLHSVATVDKSITYFPNILVIIFVQRKQAQYALFEKIQELLIYF